MDKEDSGIKAHSRTTSIPLTFPAFVTNNCKTLFKAYWSLPTLLRD